jgi:mRNA-degrading endonuclease RelE of RelBE toxin-antitoxin system
MSYQVMLTPTAVEQIKKLNFETQRETGVKLEELALNPQKKGAQKLEGSELLYKVLLGEYRIICQIKDKPLLITVMKVAHLSDY